jgi:hypothetical protein
MIRYIAEARQNPPEPPEEESTHFVVFVHEGEPPCVAEERARWTCEHNGWEFLSVGPESDTRNIPRLEPRRWAERVARSAELNRRAGIAWQP